MQVIHLVIYSFAIYPFIFFLSTVISISNVLYIHRDSILLYKSFMIATNYTLLGDTLHAIMPTPSRPAALLTRNGVWSQFASQTSRFWPLASDWYLQWAAYSLKPLKSDGCGSVWGQISGLLEHPCSVKLFLKIHS